MMPNLYQLDFDFRQLRSFMVIADTLSFRKAAEKLHIAQPALSRQIAQLEEALECQLFDRQKRQIQLTDAGNYLYESLPGLFENLKTLSDRTTAIANGKVNQLKFGYTSAAMASFLPSIIKLLHTELENCEFEFVERTSDELIQSVIAKNVDAAFILHRPKNILLKTIPIKSGNAGVVLPDDHPLTKKAAVNFHDLEHTTLILFPRKTNPTMYDEIISQCQKAGFSPKHIIETTPRSTAIAMVAAGQGVATISETLKHTCPQGTVYKPLTQTSLMVNHSCIVRKQQTGRWLELLTHHIETKFS
ncbi:MAG: LysR family transcriptional regulator [Pseudomonadota bacterium]